MLRQRWINIKNELKGYGKLILNGLLRFGIPRISMTDGGLASDYGGGDKADGFTVAEV
jgi:hypothetical protein